MGDTITMEIRHEDLGKMLFRQAPTMHEDKVVREAEKFFDFNEGVETMLFYARELNYFTVFALLSVWPARNFYDFLENSIAKDSLGREVPLREIKNIEFNEELNILEMFIEDKYFQLMPWPIETL